MSIDARKLINNPFTLKLAYLIGKYTPFRQGRRFAIFIGDRISARKNWKMVQIVRCNQWVVSGCQADKETLDQLVKENFRSIAISVFDFYHSINNPTDSLRMVEPHPMALEILRRPEYTDQGLLIAGIHMSNFDMAFRLSGMVDIKALSMTVPEFNPSYEKQYEMRRESGLNVVPTSFGTIKQAITRLRAGGVVITAIDWPDPNPSYRPMFFGFPSTVPIHHIFMALKAKVPIIVAGVYRSSDTKYHFFFSEPIEMQPHRDRTQEILTNAKNVLQVAEGYIREHSSQWSMSFPVWPEMLEKVPY